MTLNYRSNAQAARDILYIRANLKSARTVKTQCTRKVNFTIFELIRSLYEHVSIIPRAAIESLL